MRSGNIPPKGEPDHGKILEAVREALNDNPRLAEMPTEEVGRQLVLGRYLKDEPSLRLVAEALQTIEGEEGNPT